MRAFFGLAEVEGEEEDDGPAEGEELLTDPTERGTRQAREPLDATKARQVRAFFELPEAEGGEGAGPAGRGTQQLPNPSNAVEEGRRISDAPFGPGADG